MTNNHHFMLVVSVLIFAGGFWAAYWLDSRKVFMAKTGFEETNLTITPPSLLYQLREISRANF